MADENSPKVQKQMLIDSLQSARTKLYNALGQPRDMTTDQKKQWCYELADRPAAERADFIRGRWGEQDLSNCESLLWQIEGMESKLHKMEEQEAKEAEEASK